MKPPKQQTVLFLAFVALPTLAATLYFLVVASDIYISESQFVIRTPGAQGTSVFGDLLKSSGFSRSSDDSYSVQDYILSRDALRTLNQELHLKERFSSQAVDPFSRFGLIDPDSSFENFYKYYQRMAAVQLDASSSISTLTTRAYTAEDAFRMNSRLLELSEALVNKLNERGRQDLIRYSNHEVEEAKAREKLAAVALARYRNRNGVIDPEKQTAIPLQEIAKLKDQLLEVHAQIAQLERVAADNPQLPYLRRRAALLQETIDTESAHVAGAGASSLAGQAAEFQSLTVELEFSEKLLATSLSSLESALADAQRTQLYLERIVQPNMPDKAMEPKRFRSVVAVFILGLVIWGISSMLITGIREHQD